MLEHRQATDGRSGGSFATQAPSYTAFTRVQVLVKVPRFIRIKSRSKNQLALKNTVARGMIA